MQIDKKFINMFLILGKKKSLGRLPWRIQQPKSVNPGKKKKKDSQIVNQKSMIWLAIQAGMCYPLNSKQGFLRGWLFLIFS